MKKLIAVLLCMALFLTGCASTQVDNNDDRSAVESNKNDKITFESRIKKEPLEYTQLLLSIQLSTNLAPAIRRFCKYN